MDDHEHRGLKACLVLLACLLVLSGCFLLALRQSGDVGGETDSAPTTPSVPALPSPGVQGAQAPEVMETMEAADTTEGDESDCPLAIGGGTLESVRSSPAGTSWRYSATTSVDSLVKAVLMQMQREGWRLVDATGLDLFGEAWGCVAYEPQDGHVVLVTMLPGTIGGIDNEDATTKVSVVRFSSGA
jgi:hypothetical protein